MEKVKKKYEILSFITAVNVNLGFNLDSDLFTHTHTYTHTHTLIRTNIFKLHKRNIQIYIL